MKMRRELMGQEGSKSGPGRMDLLFCSAGNRERREKSWEGRAGMDINICMIACIR